MAAVILATAGPAAADPGARRHRDAADRALDHALELRLARLARRPSLGHQLQAKLSLWGNELGDQLQLLTLDLVDLDFDVLSRRADLRLGTVTQRVGFLINGHIQMRGNVARIKTRLTLGLEDSHFELDLPTFEVASQSVQGERSVELRVPILEGSF